MIRLTRGLLRHFGAWGGGAVVDSWRRKKNSNRQRRQVKQASTALVERPGGFQQAGQLPRDLIGRLAQVSGLLERTGGRFGKQL